MIVGGDGIKITAPDPTTASGMVRVLESGIPLIHSIHRATSRHVGGSLLGRDDDLQIVSANYHLPGNRKFLEDLTRLFEDLSARPARFDLSTSASIVRWVLRA